MNTSIKIILDSKAASNGQHSVYLRIIKERKSKKIALNLRCEKKYFDNEQFLKGHPNYKEQNKLLISMKARAEKIVRDLQLDTINFSLDDFENKFRGRSGIPDLKISPVYEEIITELEKAGRMSYAKSFKDTRNSFLKFTGKNILFKDINVRLIEKREIYLREHNNHNGGIAFKMRHLRRFFNIAIKRGYMSKDNYPFETYQISRIKTNSNKIAIDVEEFKKIRDVNLEGRPELLEAYNYFMFSFYSRGMNFADMANLKWENIINGRIIYRRSKTNHHFNILLSKEAQEIIDYYKGNPKCKEYVFPILLHTDLTPKQVAYRKQKVLQRYNSKLKEVAALAGVNRKLTSYVARHSFATILKNLGTSIDKISEMMGHSNVDITKSYLKDFGDAVLDSESEKLSNL